jgi:hypothetical protein
MEKVQTIVRIYRPDLTPEERAHRREAIKKSAAKLVIAAEAARRKKVTQ